MAEPRAVYAATLLRDGMVLVEGGYNDSFTEGLASAELYDPSSGSWNSTASMIQGRQFQTATLLLDGRVLVAGGEISGPGQATAVHLYEPGGSS
jgi:hypothetical protein